MTQSVGFFNKLTPAQQKEALSYRGPENHGDPSMYSSITLFHYRGAAYNIERVTSGYRLEREGGIELPNSQVIPGKVMGEFRDRRKAKRAAYRHRSKIKNIIKRGLYDESAVNRPRKVDIQGH